MNEKTTKSWQEFLKPVLGGLVVLMAAGANALQYKQSGTNDKMEARLAALETRIEVSEKRSDKFGSDIDNFKLILGDIRSDVAYIRGKMEGGK